MMPCGQWLGRLQVHSELYSSLYAFFLFLGVQMDLEHVLGKEVHSKMFFTLYQMEKCK